MTENGTALKSEPLPDGTVPDDFQIAFVRAHLEQLQVAFRAGGQVDAYSLWILMDNDVWGDSYRPESAFGRVHIDRTTLRRTPKKSYGWYRGVRTTNVVPPVEWPYAG